MQTAVSFDLKGGPGASYPASLLRLLWLVDTSQSFVPVDIELCRKREWELAHNHLPLKSSHCDGFSSIIDDKQSVDLNGAVHVCVCFMCVCSAFFWLLSLLLSAAWWKVVIPLREVLVFGLVFSVIFQEVCRCLFYLLLKWAVHPLVFMVTTLCAVCDKYEM